MATPTNKYQLGDVGASEQLIHDLYLDLRRKTRLWAAITMQTAQARMGYIGQHLVSVATGCRGGKSGARGYDLVHPDRSYGEIKTCYRVDQLGRCAACGTGVAPDEETCSACGSADVERKDDSKWLISIRNREEYAELADPSRYYLVLFEYVDISLRSSIRASIWSVDPRNPGFVLCMVDYYENIRANSKSKAPFNLWPYSFKFELMRPSLIYQSIIGANDVISTLIFPGRDDPQPHLLSPATVLARARVKPTVWNAVARRFGDPGTAGALAFVEYIRSSGRVDNKRLVDEIAREFYRPTVAHHLSRLPDGRLSAAAAGALG